MLKPVVVADKPDRALRRTELAGMPDASQYRPLRAKEEDAAFSIGVEVRNDAARRLTDSIQSLQAFLQRTECRDCTAWDPTTRLGKELADKAQSFLREALNDAAPPPSEPTLRSAYRLIASLDNLAAWSAPATQESHALASFPAPAARDPVSYSRLKK